MVISSRKGLVSLLAQSEELDQQSRHALRHSTNKDLLLDIWTSTSQKSYFAVIVSSCPNLNRKSPLMLEDITTGGKPSTHILDFVELSDERHTTDSIKTVSLGCPSR
ncbi:putative transposase of the Rover1 hAT-like family [Lachancea thermotolerans]